MVTEAGGFMDFMAKEVPIRRSHLYSLRFLFLFGIGGVFSLIQRSDLTIDTFAFPLAFAVLVCASIYIPEKYGNFSDRTRIILSLVVLVILIVLIWRHEMHKQRLHRPYVPDSVPKALYLPR